MKNNIFAVFDILIMLLIINLQTNNFNQSMRTYCDDHDDKHRLPEE